MNWRGGIRRAFAFLIAAVAGFMLAYLIAAFVVFPSGGVIPEDGSVPAVTGLPFASAQTEIRRAGFQPARGETRPHASAPPGTVLEQTPSGGSREPMGAIITLTVSGGQAPQPVPNVVGMRRDAAERALVTAGFTVSVTEERSSPQPAGEVIDTRPRPGTTTTVPSSVALVISSGPSLTPTPDVIGLSLGQARQLLESAGLIAGDIAFEQSIGSTVVTAQSPAAGTQVPAQTRVSLRLTGETSP